MSDTNFSNSYILTDALLETMIGADPRAAAIALKAAATAIQEWYCQQATKAIDRLNFSGYKLLYDQARQFPRKYLYDPEAVFPWDIPAILFDIDGYIYESADVPAFVLDACKEEAIALYKFYNDSEMQRREDLQQQNVSSISEGGQISESYKPGLSKYEGLKSAEAYRLLEPYLDNAPLII
jgi:hypothetical protein